MNFSSYMESLISTMPTVTLYDFRYSLTVSKVSSLVESVIAV